jgi:hypothetical protein
MFLERYEYKKGFSSKQFYFHSQGPKGRIHKVVYYRYLGKVDGFYYFNLGFGDFDPKSGKISDLTVSDNKDREMVLATVASTALEFTRLMRKCRLIVTGSTPARTRLYQMKISVHYHQISELFDIQGQTEKGWVRFKKGEKYLRFLFERINFKQ